MHIACDVDGVVAALHQPWFDRYNRDYNDNLTLDRVTNWNTHEFVKPECGKKIYEYLQQPDLYDDVPALPGAAECIRRIRELGHELFFVTSNTYGMTDQKALWLERKALVQSTGHTRQLPHELVITHTKRYVDADVIIEDKGETICDWLRAGKPRAILIEYPHNAALNLHSSEWRRVNRISAYPDASGVWPAILKLFETQAV